MSSHKIHGRRRAVAARTNPLAAVSKAVADNAAGAGRQAAVVAAASGLVLTGGIAASAAEVPVQRDSAPASTLETASQRAAAPLMADSNVKISFDRPAVTTAPAPVIEKAAATIKAPQRTAAVQAPAAKAQIPAAKAQITVRPQAAPAPAAAPQAAGGVNAIMLSSAYAQLGITQDCTRLVEKALGAAGIPVGDIGPMAFMKYGKVVSAPTPGDMVVQSGHVGIYVGNGQVLSSGMNGKNQTVVHPMSWLTATGPVTFVRAGA
ncbi:MAG: NlpC/P60 family protein [Arthrobacter sp.]